MKNKISRAYRAMVLLLYKGMGTWQATLCLRPLSSISHTVLLLLIGAFYYTCSKANISSKTWRYASINSHKHELKAGPSSLELWTLFPAGYDNETAVVQRRIKESQNPTDCENGKYFVYNLNNYGMGSDLHMLGLMIGFAMQHKRTLLYHPNTNWQYTSEDFCHEILTPDCFFRPLSRCQYMANSIGAISKWYDDTSRDPVDDQFLLAPSCFDLDMGLVPSLSDWSTKGISWWRAQTTRYLARPSDSLFAWARHYFVQDLVRYPPSTSWNASTQPPPDDAICIHIRHGDKFKEMTLHPMAEYLEAAAWLAGNDTRLSLSQSIFLSTDDPNIIDDIARGRYDHMNFTFYYTRYRRQYDDISPGEIATNIGRGLLGSISVANLILGVHPHCKAFVQTTGSNWNRLINEIRKTDGERSNAAFIDLEPGEWRKT